MIPVLFTKYRSPYLQFPEADCWDIHRDDRKYQGDSPVIAHPPPCRAWGTLRRFSKPREDERELFGPFHQSNE